MFVGDTQWLDASELRIGLGCMRMSTDESRDEEIALETIAAAAEAGMTVFDTARAYGRGPSKLGHNERLLARALRRSSADGSARIVTKGGMTRTGGGWIPDGRARAILTDCEASLAALDGLAIDLYLIHAPDPRTPWRTSVRALARLLDEGLVRHVGLANVNRRQLDEALELAPVTAVQVALGPFDDRALRGGLVGSCAERGIAVIAHSPLGGPRRAGGLARHRALAGVAAARSTTPAEVALAWLLDLSPAVVAIPGARRPETARSAAGAAKLGLDAGDRAVLARAFGGTRPARLERPPKPDDADVVLVMGIPGAGKSRVAEKYVERFGALPTPEELRGLARREPGMLVPTSQMRALRELEPPSTDEGLAGVEQVPFARTPSSPHARLGVFVAAAALTRPGWEHALEQGDRGAPHLVFDWRPDGTSGALAAGVARLSAEVSGPVESALCPHAAGPPSCWCRPPLPGLPLAFARAHGVDPSRSILVGAGPAHRTLATALGAHYVPV